MPTTSDVLPAFQLSDGRAERAFPTGRTALLCFVYEECPTCRLTLPLIEQLAAAFGSQVDVLVVGQEAVGNAALVAECGLRAAMLDDTALAVSWAYGIETVPTLVLADGAGQELRRFHGFVREEFQALADELSRLSGAAATTIAWDSYPALRPGCGSRTQEPGIFERLRAEAEGSPLRARRIAIGADDDAFEFMFEQGLTDGLPVVPPTAERVLRMLAATRRAAQEEIAVLAPNLAPLTIEKAAINAVMAGCTPEYFPVVLAATEAIATEEFNIHGCMATTMGGTPVLVVNGPIRERIGMNAGQNALGQGNRANATIGRAVRLVIRNVGGHRPGGTERSTIGSPAKYTLAFAEREERAPEWTPLHVQRGFRREESVVTAFCVSGGPSQVRDETSRSARALAGSLGLKAREATHPRMPAMGDILVVVSPEHYDTLARDGWSKEDVVRRIQEVGERPLGDLLESADVGGVSPGWVRGFLKGDEPREEALTRPVRKFARDEMVHIVVAGGTAGKFSAVFDPWSGGYEGSIPVSMKIEEGA